MTRRILSKSNRHFAWRGRPFRAHRTAAAENSVTLNCDDSSSDGVKSPGARKRADMTQPDAFEEGKSSAEPGSPASPPPGGGASAARKILIGFALVVVFGGGYYLIHHHSRSPLEVAFAGNRHVTLWSTTAQVREPVTVVNYGTPLDVLQRSEEQLEVRTTGGVIGWVSDNEVLSADLWLKARDLDESLDKMPIEASGHTRVIANLHILPGRDAVRVRQLQKDIPVDLYLRKAVDVPSAANAGDSEESSVEPAEAKKEDWWLVRAHTSKDDSVAGWVLGRFIALDVPEPLPDYASSAGVHIVSWAVLNQVKDSTGHVHPQYLVLASEGPEGQPCDFTMLRAYTWGIKSQRYETAFVESGLCGMLPLHLEAARQLGGDATFSFQDESGGASELRTYHMRQTIIRREREAGETAHSGKHAR